MKIIDDTKFAPIKSADGVITGYLSTTTVEVEGEAFTASRFMAVDEHAAASSMMLEFIHHALRTDIMLQIRRKLFKGVSR